MLRTPKNFTFSFRFVPIFDFPRTCCKKCYCLLFSGEKVAENFSPKKREHPQKKRNTVLAAWTKKRAGDRQEKRRETQTHAPCFPACPLPRNDIRIFPGKPLQQEKLLSFLRDPHGSELCSGEKVLSTFF